MLRISNIISSNSAARGRDVLKIKDALRSRGYYDLPDYGITPYTDEALFDGIKQYQKDKGLKVDGIIKPDGETMQTLEADESTQFDEPHHSIMLDTDKPPPLRTMEKQDDDLDEGITGWYDRILENGYLPREPENGFEEDDDILINVREPILLGPVGNNLENGKRDVIGLQGRLGEFGLLPKDKLSDPTGFLDRETSDAIKNIQRQLGLKEDGLVHPGGETEQGIEAIKNVMRLQGEEKTQQAFAQAASFVKGVIDAVKGEGSTADKINAFAPVVSMGLSAVGGPIAGIASQALSGTQAFFNTKDALESDGDVLTKINEILPAVASGAQAAQGLAGSLGSAASGLFDGGGETGGPSGALETLKAKQQADANSLAETGRVERSESNSVFTSNSTFAFEKSEDTPPLPKEKPIFDATGRMIRKEELGGYDKEKYLDTIENVYREYVDQGHKKGLNEAADNLEHFLDGSGEDKALSRDQVREKLFVRNGERVNRDRFTKSFTDKKGIGSKLLNMKEDEVMEVKDNWDYKVGNFPIKTMIRNADLSRSHLLKGDLDEALATGTSSVKSGGDFKVKRKGNTILIDGTVTHQWTDKYNFDPLQSGGGGATILEKEGRAKSFDINSQWQQKVTGTVQIKGGELVNPRLTWEDAEENK